MTITIRPLQASDKSDWHQLWQDYLAFYDSAVTEDVYHTTFERLLSPQHPKQNAFIAFAESHMVGLVHYIYHPHN